MFGAITQLVDGVQGLSTAAIGRAPKQDPICLVCRNSVATGEEHLTVHGANVHRRCATYRVRQVRAGRARLGYPPH